ncbi:MAG: AraC family transcriptional regulator [Clostridia bacterium]|nr:AraC family transcriptional regulator [Clostridia bacterium]
MENEGFTYNHSIFRSPDFNFKAHAHNAYELIFFINGDAIYNVEDRKYVLQKHDLIITHPMQSHFVQLNSNADYERFDILIFPNSVIAGYLAALPQNTEVVSCNDNKLITDCFKRMSLYENMFKKNEFNILMNSLLTELCFNLQVVNKNVFLMPQFISPIIKESLSYINANLFTVKDISEISDYLFVAKNYFFRLFKEQMKITPKKYITNKRLLHAQNLISNGEKPTEIYNLCGFSNYVSFYKAYLDFFGSPPSGKTKK